jgi:hypothetical protein
MHLIYCTRDDLLSALPPGGAAAEIGVATGAFSQVILNRTRPRLLHLVDPWEFQDREDYLEDRNNVAQDVADKRYNEVKARFASQIESGQVALHRAFSTDAAREVADSSLDWVFIDAMHTRDAVLEDLTTWSAKVKSDGFILGHDYANHTRALQAEFGVVEAVREFCEANGYHFAFLTAEPFPSYLIVKDIASAAWARLKQTVIKHLPCVVELTDPFALTYKQREYDVGDGTKVVFSFSPLPVRAADGVTDDDRLGEVVPLLCRPGTLIDTAAGRHGETLAALDGVPVIGFEPSSAGYFALFNRLAPAGSLPAHIALHHAAAGAAVAAGRRLTLPIDQFALSDLAFLNIEADGNEEDILRGAADTIARCKPVIRLGAPAGRAESAAVLLDPSGYRGFVLSNGLMTDHGSYQGAGADSILFIRQDDLWALQRLAQLASDLFAKAQLKAS